MAILDQFILDCRRLVFSLVIKLDGIAYNMNRELTKRNYTISTDKSNWKYYLNISGQQHESNDDVYINLVEGTYSNTSDNILLTRLLNSYSDYDAFIKDHSISYTESETNLIKDVFDSYASNQDYFNNIDNTLIRKLLAEVKDSKYDKLSIKLLKKYNYTKDYILTNSEYLDELIDIYPNEFLYILGCIYSIDIKTAINAANGTILGYNSTLVEDSEYNLIQELENYAKRFLTRYYNHKYVIVDELYVPSILGILYSLLLQKVINVRTANMFTNKAHSFHMEAYLRGKFNIYEYMSNLSDSSKFWIYKNIDRISKNIGSNNNLQEIIDNIMSPNDIGLAQLKLISSTPTLKEDYSDIKQKQFDLPEKKLLTSKLNNEYPVEDILEVKEIVTIEVEDFSSASSDTEEGKNIITSITTNIQNNHRVNNNELSKAIDIKMARTYSFHGSNTFDIIMNYWAYLLNRHDKYKGEKYSPPVIEYTDPNNYNYYELTPYTGFLLVLRLLLEYVGEDYGNIKPTKYNYDSILRPIDEGNIINGSDMFWMVYDNYLYQNSYDKVWLNELHNEYPDTGAEVTSQLQLELYFEEVIHYLDLKFTIEANTQNHLVSTNIKQLHEMLYISGSLDLNNKGNTTIDKLLLEEGIKFVKTEGYDTMNTIFTLIRSITGVDITGDYTREQTISNFKNILNKLTSYTTQIINVDTEDSITGSDDTYLNVYYNRMTVANTDNPLIMFEMNELDMYHITEHYAPEVNGYIDEFKDKFDKIVVNDTKIRSEWVNNNPFKMLGTMLSKNNSFNPLEPPNTSVGIIKISDY